MRELDWYIGEVRSRLGLSGNAIDDAFVQAIADWQRQFSTSHHPPLRVDGVLGPMTEAHLAIQLPCMDRLVQRMRHYYEQGGILFDSWGNDWRDNDGDGLVDERDEVGADGSHAGRVYHGFGYGPRQDGATHGGWSYYYATDADRRDDRRTYVHEVHRVPSTVLPVTGDYRYMMCSDLVSMAMVEAGIIRQHGRTGALLRHILPAVGYVFRRRDDYPEIYLAGDFIATWAPGGGHSAVVVEREATQGGANGPVVVELPGPSTMIEEEYYRPDGQHGSPPQANAPPRGAGVRGDVMMTRWPDFRRLPEDAAHQYLVRFIYSRIGRRR